MSKGNVGLNGHGEIYVSRFRKYNSITEKTSPWFYSAYGANRFFVDGEKNEIFDQRDYDSVCKMANDIVKVHDPLENIQIIDGNLRQLRAIIRHDACEDVEYDRLSPEEIGLLCIEIEKIRTKNLETKLCEAIAQHRSPKCI